MCLHSGNGVHPFTKLVAAELTDITIVVHSTGHACRITTTGTIVEHQQFWCRLTTNASTDHYVAIRRINREHATAVGTLHLQRRSRVGSVLKVCRTSNI